jgi:hypothetical protein
MRIARMQRLLLDGRGHSWARSAVEHGYHYEAHMASDVGELDCRRDTARVARKTVSSKRRAVFCRTVVETDEHHYPGGANP